MKYKDYNDYELLYMVRENDDLSRDLLLKKYSPIINKIALDFFNNYKNYGYEYDDFYQEAMLAFNNAVVSYNENKNTLFYTFVVVCIKRALLSFTRNISSKNANYNLLVELNDSDLIDEKSNIEDIFKDKEIQDICMEIIYNPDLSIKDTSILELRMNGFTWKEISILLDSSNSSIQFRFRKMKNELLKYLSIYECK